MWEKLARHAKPQVSLQFPEATQSPKEKSAPIEWQKPIRTGSHGTAYVLSVCGRFSIDKSTNEHGFAYCAWDLSTKSMDGGMATGLGCEESKEAAIALCESVR